MELGAWDNKDLETLLDANKAWAARKAVENPQLFEDMKMPHSPKIMWIGCSDARVPANELIGEPPGNVFVTRNIANNVISTDGNLMSVLQYGKDLFFKFEVLFLLVLSYQLCSIICVHSFIQLWTT